jgi:predicted DNA-binding transcriptional regulator AlpA
MTIEIPGDRAADIGAVIRYLLELLAEYTPASALTSTQRGRDQSPGARVTVEQFCDEMNIAPSTFYEWRAKKKAPKCIKLPNGRVVIRRAEIDRWLESLEVA